MEKQETEKGYNDNKTEIENLKKEQATENPQKYSEEAKKRIEEKLKYNQVKEGELTNENQKEWQKLKNGEIKDPDQLVATETKIKENIYQKEAEKKIADLTTRVNKTLKSNPSKSQISNLKKELLNFISSSNIYYSTQRKTAEILLTQLENYLITDNSQNNTQAEKGFPWKILIPLPFLIGLILIIKIILNRKSKRK